jgi:hypothetical protein
MKDPDNYLSDTEPNGFALFNKQKRTNKLANGTVELHSIQGDYNEWNNLAGILEHASIKLAREWRE